MTRYFWTIAFTWVTPAGIGFFSDQGNRDIANGASRDQIFCKIRAEVCKQHRIPDTATVTFFSLEPDRIGGEQ